MVSKKHVFWQALFSAILTFGIGLLLGLWLEESRSTEIEKLLLQSEVNVLDSQLIGTINENLNITCNVAKEKLFQFADDIFSEAQLLEQYDDSSQLKNTLQIVHRKYDLLRLILWSESLKVKEKCNEDFYTVVYFYQYKDPPINIKSQQVAFSRFLKESKEKYGEKLLLIPLAGDLNLSSIELAKSHFQINSYPAVIVNEEISITNLDDLRRLDEIILG